MHTDANRAAYDAAGRIFLCTLGGASMRSAQSSRDEIMSGATKQLALVAYLACKHERSAPRGELIRLLWGSTDERRSQTRPRGKETKASTSARVPNPPTAGRQAESRANDAFRNALDELREKLGRDIFGPPRADPLRLSNAIAVDRDAFKRASHQRDDVAAASLYTGPFLPHFELLRAPTAFGHWVETERASLRRDFIDVAVRLGSAADEATIGDVVTLSQRLLQLEEVDEEAWIAILTSLLRFGGQAYRAEVGERLRILLEAQGAEPTAALLRLLQSSGARNALDVSHRARDDRAAAPILPTRHFVGRAAELAAAHRAWEVAIEGAKAHLHFVSPSGYGKSALLERARELLRGGTAATPLRRSLRLVANQGTSEVPYQFAGELAALLAARPGASGIDATHAAALVTLAPKLVEFFPSAKRLRGAIETHHDALAAALAELLHVLSSDEPFALFLDDLHWSDDASLRLLAAAWQRCPPVRLLMLTAARTACEAFCDATTGATRVLTPLDERDIRAMLEADAALPRDAWARELPALLHDVSEGSPLQVVEQLKLLADRRLLSHTGARWRTRDSAALLDALEHPGATARRIERLAPEPRDVLLLLAVAGSPLSEDTLRAASGCTSDELSRHLATLEQRGFVLRSGDALHLVHDAHAEAVLRLAVDSSVQRAAAGVGRALFRTMRDDGDDRPLYADHLRQLQQVARLLIAGGDRPSLERVFEHVARRGRSAGDRRPNRVLALELLRPGLSRETEHHWRALSSPDRLMASLESSLPWRLRFHRAIRVGGWTLLTFALVATSAAMTARFVTSRAAETPRITLLASRIAHDGQSALVSRQPLMEPDLTTGRALEVNLSGTPYAKLPRVRIADGGQLRSDGLAWVTEREAADSGGLDIYEVGRNGGLRRLTNSPGDDVAPSWAPDNAHIVFSTARWNAMAQYDIASYDTLTRAIHQLTSGDDRDVRPLWSPDGSRIAFEREYWSGGKGICVMDSDGTHLDCGKHLPSDMERLHGWISSRELLLERAVDSTHWALVRRDATSHLERRVDAEFVSQFALQLSPDGRWVVCRCVWRSRSVRGWSLFPLDDPQSVRALSLPDSLVESINFTWLPAEGSSALLRRLVAEHGPGDVQIDSPYQLTATGYGSKGIRVDVGTVRWRALDSTIRVDSFGVVRASLPATFRIEASAGGWVRDTLTLSSTTSTPRTVFDERWDAALSSSWVLFGMPRPTIVHDTLFGRAFFNNGDEFYFSGAYSRQTFSTRSGLWVEAQLSTPITPNSQWQEQLLTLFAASDSSWLSAWDHATGDMLEGDCRVFFPKGDGVHRGDSILVPTPSPSVRVPAPTWLRTGRPFRAMVQIFPDGRCGFALNDDVFWISPPAFRDSLARVKIDGRSVRTRVLVGPLRVSTGTAPNMRAALH